MEYILAEKRIQLPSVPSACLITYSDTFLHEAKRRFDYRCIDIGSRKPTEIYFFRKDEGKNFAIVNPQYGDAMAVTTLEELIALGEIASERQEAVGFHTFLSMGTAGHPTNADHPQKLSVGDIVVVTAALKYEGSSDHYASKENLPEADEHVVRLLCEVLDHRGVHYQNGIVATTSGIYRETPTFIKQILEKDAIGIDMETSALLTVAKYHGKKMGTILYISDVVHVDGWNVEFLSGDVSETEIKVFDAAMDAINKL
ncbi:MAG: hypothetical protein V1743_05605 [Nanoarchaeota archaeon]